MRLSTLYGSRNSTQNETIVEIFYFDVLLNEHDISQANEVEGGTIRAKVDKVVIHPNYDNATFNFDAALIRLAEPVELNQPHKERKDNQQQQKIQERLSQVVQPTARQAPASKRQIGAQHHFYYNAFDFHSLVK